MSSLSVNKLSLQLLGGCLLISIGHQAYAGSLSLSYGELKQPFTYMEDTVTFKPTGPSVMMSFELNDRWSVDFDYQKWDDSLVNDDLFRSNSELTGWGTGISHFKGNWSFGLSYNHSSDETYAESVSKPQSHNHWEQADAKSWGLSVGYGWLSGEMFYNLSLSAQMSDWDSETKKTVTLPPPPPPSGGGQGGGGQGGGGQGGGGQGGGGQGGGGQGGGGQGGGGQGGGGQGGGQNPPPPQVDNIHDISSGDASSVSASFSLARYWPLKDDTGVLVGGMLSWNHMLSGDSELLSSTGRRPPPPRQPPRGGGNNSGPASGASGAGNLNRAGGGNISSASGDDSYGQISFYVSYDLNESWSVDVDTGIDIGTDENEVIWSLSVGYFW